MSETEILKIVRVFQWASIARVWKRTKFRFLYKKFIHIRNPQWTSAKQNSAFKVIKSSSFVQNRISIDKHDLSNTFCLFIMIYYYLHWKVLLMVRQVPSLLQGFGKFGGHWPKTAQPVNPSKTGFILKFGKLFRPVRVPVHSSPLLPVKSLFKFSLVFLVVFRIYFFVFFFLCG